MAAAPAIELEVDYLVYKDSSGAEVVQSVREMAAPTGGIQAFAMPTAPDGWLICDGSNNLLISDFPALYEAISFDYNCTVGNGSTVVTVNGDNTDAIAIGNGVRAVGVPPGATVVQINSANTFTMSVAANANNTGSTKVMYWGQGANISTFRIPDLRGEHLRGWDRGRGVDSNRDFASWQQFLVGKHRHNFHGGHSGSQPNGHWTGRAYVYGSNGRNGNQWTSYPRMDYNTDGTGEVWNSSIDETRVRNFAINYCIKF